MSWRISALPLQAWASRKLLQQRQSIFDRALERWEVAPGAEIAELPAIALSGEHERIKQARHYPDLKSLAATLAGTTRWHAPTVAYRYKDALLADGVLYVNGGHDFVAARRRSPILAGHVEDFDAAALCADVGSDMFFGRWLRDALCKELLAQEMKLAPVNQSNPLRLHEAGYRALLGLDAPSPRRAHFDSLVLIDDQGYNRDRIRRFRALRSRLRATPDDNAPRRIYIGRGKLATSGRDVVNAAELETALVRRGFAIIHPEAMTPGAIHSALSNAHIVVAVEGSALAHAQLAMPEGAVMITIQPSNRFNTAHKSAAEAGGLRFGYVVAAADRDGLAVDQDRLLRTIDLAEDIERAPVA